MQKGNKQYPQDESLLYFKFQSFAQLPHLKKHMLCVHNTDKPYYCEVCEGYFKIKTEYEEHAAKDHPDELPVRDYNYVLQQQF